MTVRPPVFHVLRFVSRSYPVEHVVSKYTLRKENLYVDLVDGSVVLTRCFSTQDPAANVLPSRWRLLGPCLVPPVPLRIDRLHDV